MSIEHINAVLKRYRGKAHLKLTLLVLADAADPETGQCWPSYDSIAGQTNVTRRVAITNVRQLMDQGVIDRIDQGGFRVDTHTGKQVFVSNVYRVNLELLNSLPHWFDIARKPVDKSADNPVDNPSHGAAHDTVSVLSASPCSSAVHSTLNVIQEPSEEPPINADAPTETLRDQRIRERRGIREAINAESFKA